MYSWLEEGGIGSREGEAPGEANPWPHGEAMSYYPVPFFLSTRGFAVWLDTTYYNVVELATEPRPDVWRAWMASPRLAYEIYLPIPGDTRPWPYQLIDQFTATTGRPMIPPAWTYGPRRRLGHGSRVGDVSEIQAMRDLDLAITAFDDAFHYLPNGTTPEMRAGLPAATAEARRLGYRVNGYFNSMFSASPDDPVAPLTQEGLAAHHFLRKASGEPAEGWIITGDHRVVLYLLDFTSAAATDWYQDLFQLAIDAATSAGCTISANMCPPKSSPPRA
jgi:alpha-D-xyloside xylohydrolase